VTRSLLLTGLCAFLAAVGFFTLAAMFGAKDFRGMFGEDGFHRHGRWDRNVEAGGPEVVKTLAWGGGDELRITVPGHIVYTQGPESSIRITGPRGTVERIELDDEAIRFDRRFRNAADVEIVMTAPAVEEFHLMGSQRLEIHKFDRPRLETHTAGSADITADGVADLLDIQSAGSADIDMGAVKARRAEVHIAGSGDAVVAPTDEIEVHVAGSGRVTLKTRPPKIESHIAGSGRIVQAEEEPKPAPAKPEAAKPAPAKPEPKKTAA
jgi:hypothetical protein